MEDTNSGVFDIETEDESSKCKKKIRIKKRNNENMEDNDKKLEDMEDMEDIDKKL